jgi:23S rRNA (guanosine2251-2'-O)-methyltransferase
MDDSRQHLVPGYHAVRETLLKESSAVEALWTVPGKRSGRQEEIYRLARQRGIPIIEVRVSDLDVNACGAAHQGVALLVKEFAYLPIEDLAEKVPDASHERLVLVLDHITDEGNFGSIIRSAAFFGVEALVIPRDRSVRVTSAVLKRASGAHAGVAVSRVVNLSRALDLLRHAGLWIVGSAGEASMPIYDFDWRLPVALVLGNERKGLGAAVRKGCDQLVSIPSVGQVESLNVSVAAGVVLGEIVRQRRVMPPLGGIT